MYWLYYVIIVASICIVLCICVPLIKCYVDRNKKNQGGDDGETRNFTTEAEYIEYVTDSLMENVPIRTVTVAHPSMGSTVVTVAEPVTTPRPEDSVATVRAITGAENDSDVQYAVYVDDQEDDAPNIYPGGVDNNVED